MPFWPVAPTPGTRVIRSWKSDGAAMASCQLTTSVASVEGQSAAVPLAVTRTESPSHGAGLPCASLALPAEPPSSSFDSMVSSKDTAASRATAGASPHAATARVAASALRGNECDMSGSPVLDAAERRRSRGV
jgi:hypothetical protein